MFKTVLAHVRSAPRCEALTRAAVDFARRREATLVGLGARAPAYELVATGVETLALGAMMEAEAVDLAEARRRFEAAAGTLGERARWVVRRQRPNAALADEAACADLVFAEASPGEGSASAVQPSSLVMEIGLPVVFLPRDVDRIAERSILVAWRNTAEARGAITAALPLLRQAERVAIVQVAGEGETAAEALESLDGIRRRLERHGVTASAEVKPRTETAALTLMAEAAAREADMIVMGGYGHSRAREWILGGVTQDLLASTDRPLFIAR